MELPHRAFICVRPALRAGRIIFALWGILSALTGNLTSHGAEPASVIPDPTADGWNSESYAEATQAVLKRLLAPLAEGSAIEELKGTFAVYPEVKEISTTPTVTVSRGVNVSAAKAHPTLDAALRPVVAGFDAGAPLHLKVKTTGVKLDAEPRTTHLLHLDGPAAGGRREINATLTAGWGKDAEGGPLLLSLTCGGWEDVRSPAAKAWFSDQTANVLKTAPDAARQLAAGIPHWRLRLQQSLPLFKFGHHGIAMADVNGDGQDDLYVCQPGGLPNRLFLHRPDDTLEEASAAYGLDLLDSTTCALFADFDNDGDPDLVVATSGPLVFFENDGGKRFTMRLRLRPVMNVYGLAAADYDLDGDLDLYAVRYYPSKDEGGELAVPMPQFDANNGGPNFLIRNDGSAGGEGWRVFSDATAGSGLDISNRRFSYAAVWDDVNQDGLPDLYVANDFGRNNLYIQRKQGGKLSFEDSTDQAGLKDGAFGMSASTADFNRDGWIDLHLGAMWSSAGSRITTQDRFRPELSEELRGRFRRLARGNSLFANTGKKETSFTDVSAAAGIMIGRWSWASMFSDIDSDGWPDLLVANGFVTGEIPDDL